MKFFSQALIMLGILGGIGNEVYSMNAAAPQASLSLEDLAYAVAHKMNPLFPILKGVFATAHIYKDLVRNAYDACLKKEFTPRLSSSIIKSLGAAALIASPWIVYRIWFRDFYNTQMFIYATIRDIVKKHYEVYVLGKIACNACYTQNQLIYATEKCEAIKNVRLLRTVSTLYFSPDTRLINLIDSFYKKLEAKEPCFAEYVAVQNHCMGFLK